MAGIFDIFRKRGTARGPLRLEDEDVTVAAAAPGGPLKDDQGETIEVDDLDEEHAAPTVGGVRTILTEDPSQGLDPVRLARILRAAVDGDADAYYALAEIMEEKYLHYQGVLGTRKRAVAQLEITVEAASDDAADQANADLIRDYLNRDELDGETFDILDSLGKGFSATEMIWDRSVRPWLPELVTRDPRFFEFDRTDGTTLRLKGGPDGTASMPTDLKPYKYIIHRSASKTGLTVRGGLARSVAWAYLFQTMALKDWVIFAETYGMPIRVGKYGATATETDRRKLLQAVMNIATDAAAIIPQSMTVDFINGMAGGNPEVFKQLCEYLDQQVSKLVLGQTATTDATAGGLGGSQGNVHNDVRQDIQRSDAKAYAATLNKQLVRPIVDLNNGRPKLGKYPRIRIGQAEVFTKEQAGMIYDYVDRGGKVGKSAVRDKLGVEDPAPDEELLQPLKSAPQIAGPPAPLDPSQAPPPAPTPEPASQRFSGPVKRISFAEAMRTAAASAALSQKRDKIDDLVELTADQWHEVMAPMLDPIEQLAAASTDFETFSAGLADLQAQLGTESLTDLLARSMFAARLAGEAGADVTGDAS